MRTTVDLPPAVHRRALELAHARGQSLSATLAELTARGLGQLDEPVVVRTDATSGFRIIQEPLLSQFARSFPTHFLGDTYEALVSAGRAGYTVREIPVRMRDREHGRSSASPIAAIRLILRAVIVAGTRLQFPVAPLAEVQGGDGRYHGRTDQR